MATLYISEYSHMAVAGSGMGPAFVGAQAPQEPALVEQTVAISGTPASSSAFGGFTQFIRVHTDAICSIVFGLAGSSPSAATTNKRLAANQTEFFGVSPGMLLSVISNS